MPRSKVPLTASIDVIAKAVGGGTAERQDVSCTVGGKKSQCYALRKKDERGRVTMRVLVGESSDGEQMLPLFCGAPADPLSKMPVACAQVFAQSK